MKRLLIVLVSLTCAASSFAFDPTPQPGRIALLRSSVANDEPMIAALADELRRRGLDAFDSGLTWDEAVRETPPADYLVDLAGSEPDADEIAGIGVGGDSGEISLGVVSTRMFVEVRVYDAVTLELIGSETLSSRSTAVLPTGVGIGGRALFAWFALPFVQHAQSRRVVRSAARDAAAAIEATLRPR